MNGSTKMLTAVVILIVVVAAGIAVFFVLNNNKESSADIDAALEVYGNADNDYKIDSADRKVIEKIIAKEDGYTLAKYPLADTNYDGTVNDKDLTALDKILKGEKTTVYHLNYNTDKTKYPDGSYVVSTSWPVQYCVGNGGGNPLIMYALVGLTSENVVGINYSSSSPPDKVIWPEFAAMKSLGTSTNYITEGLLQECLLANPGVSAVITGDNKIMLDGSQGLSEADLEDTYGLDVIRIRHSAVNPDEYAAGLLLLGFLFQKDTQAVEVAEWTTDVYKMIDEKVSKLDEKVRVTTSSYYYYLNATNSDYADFAAYGGGNVVTWEQAATTIYFEPENVKYDPRVYEDQYQGDVIIVYRTGSGFLKASWYDDPDTWDTENMKEHLSHFYRFKAYENKNVYHTSGDMPIVARVLYSAAIMYPDLISMDKADKLHQEFVDKFLDGKYTVKDLKFVLSQSEIEGM